MGQEKTVLGSIHISPSAIASIVYQAAFQSYGVVGLAPKNLAEGIASSITHDPNRGVNVTFENGSLVIDLYVILEYGTRITSVAQSVQNAVRFSVEKNVGLTVADVNIHIKGLRVSNPD
ncbi:MAG TPA: Asp23/Gls24 family envelope stress response protein [Anaerolineales bacterium]|nr:Asp23/Gls24 family envelope stress response protein [Anaerolineales bacterium]